MLWPLILLCLGEVIHAQILENQVGAKSAAQFGVYDFVIIGGQP